MVLNYASGHYLFFFFYITLLKCAYLQVIRSIYFAYFLAQMRCGLLFWGSDPESESIFKLRKRVT